MEIQGQSTVVEATDQDFQQKVVERSREIPVLVDFWAPWCGPCKTLTPLLEKLATELSGSFELVKVNMDENPGLAQALAIRSIPAVKLVVNAEIKDQFEGALPEPELRAFLERNLPTNQEVGAAQGLKMWLDGERQQSAAIFQQVLQTEPENAVALVGMGLFLVEGGQLEEAKKIVEKVTEFDLDHMPDKQTLNRGLSALRSRVLLVEGAMQKGGEAIDPADTSLDARYTRACQLAVSGDLQQSLELFLGIVQQDRKFQEDAGRKGLLAVFDLLPEDSDLLGEYRAKLSSLLFA